MARDDEAARYRQAAQMTLEQLTWCIDYFRTIRKLDISEWLAKNHAAISRKLEEGADRGGARRRE
jgi:hypothetical protein